MSDTIPPADPLSTSFFDTESPSGEIYSLVGSNDIAIDIMDRVARDGFCTVVHLGKFADINVWAVDGRRVIATNNGSVWEDLDATRFAEVLEKYKVKL
ncbi:MAG: hypothetical protein QM758_05945 [Armatimonas sp.]